MKRCWRCQAPGETKPLTEFYLGGKDKVCKACRNAYTNASRIKYIDRRRKAAAEYMRKYRLKKRLDKELGNGP